MPQLPPGPHTLSPLGVVPKFARHPLGLVLEAFQRYGDCVLLPGPLGQNVYLLNDPDLIHAVLVAQADKIEKPAALKWVFRSSFGDGLFFSEGDFWRRQRKLAQPAFHHKRIQSYAEGMVGRAQQMLAEWSDGQVCDLRKDLSALTLKIVVDALFSTSVEAETEQIYLALTELGRIIERQSFNPLFAILPNGAPLPLVRLALTELSLGPYRVPKGNQLWISPYTLHRHPRFYAEPETFLPERFSPDSTGGELEEHLPKFAYLPFGGGPRICIGNMFALMEARLLLATIVQRFRLVLPADANIQMHVGPTLGFEHGAPMRVARR